MRKLVVELIGTFFLVLVIGVAAVFGSAGDFAPVAIGCVLFAMVYAGGHVSGAHYNPAVTVAAYLRGRCPRADILPYIAAQIAGAVAAAAAAVVLARGADVTPLDVAVPQALLAELLFTFALVFVILNVATAQATEGNPYYGAAIGLVVMAGAFTVGEISGAAFNPAVAVGLSLMGRSPWAAIWIYLVADFAGGVAGALLFRMLDPDDP